MVFGLGLGKTELLKRLGDDPNAQFVRAAAFLRWTNGQMTPGNADPPRPREAPWVLLPRRVRPHRAGRVRSADSQTDPQKRIDTTPLPLVT